MEPQTIHYRLKESFLKNRHRIAVECGGLFITYGELDRRTDIIARLIKNSGVTKGSLVGVAVGERVDLILNIIGILKAAGVFVILDTMYPDKRLAVMIGTTQVELIVCDETNRIRLSNNVCPNGKTPEFLLVENFFSNDALTGSMAPEEPYHIPEDKIYIYFTSGTTGIPKAIIGRNESMLHFIAWEIDTFGIDCLFRFSQFTNPGFDPYLRDIFVPLCAGSTICIPENHTILINREDLEAWIGRNNINLIHCVPSLFRLFGINIINKKNFESLRFILFAGEKVIPKELKPWYESFGDRIQLVNLYGPTETTLAKVYYQIRPEDTEREIMPIGKHIEGSRAIILNENLHFCEKYTIGEIYIRTPYRSFGYLNDPELNTAKFISNPYNDDPDDILYKTGDLGRTGEDGNIELVGRMDRQEKIRGFRVELEEIERKIFNFDIGYHKRKGLENLVEIDNRQGTVRCSSCLLTSEYPGISFDDGGVCSICRDYDSYTIFSKKYFKKTTDFETLMEKVSMNSVSQYDCLLLFSGGKDSSYALYKLVAMGFKVLAYTFDNGFISEAAMKNIKTIVSQLNVDHIVSKAENMNKLFIESIKKEHSVCHGCWKAVSTLGTKLALEKGINVIITGLSRGQIFDAKLQRFYNENVFDTEEIEKRLSDLQKVSYSNQDKLSRTLGVSLREDDHDKITFIDFFRYDSSTAEAIEKFLEKNGWSRPGDTGFCSSNCMINDVGIYIHFRDKNYHNYLPSLSWDIRLGLETRRNGLKKIHYKTDFPGIQKIFNEIGYSEKPISNAVVVPKSDKLGNKYLGAYFTSSQKVNESDLKQYLEEELPDFMVPAYFLQLDGLPITPNGKIDREKLPNPNSEAIKRGSHILPANLIEKQLAEIWYELLGIEEIGVSDSFFELGGNSLNVMSLIAKIHRKFDKRLSLADIFRNVTIEKQAGLIIDKIDDKHKSLAAVEKKDYYLLSSAQMRWYSLQQMNIKSRGFNLVEIFELGRKPDIIRLTETFRELIKRHESLRTSFDIVEDKPVQKIFDRVDFNIKQFSIPDITLTERVIGDFDRIWDISQPPLIRVGLISIDEKGYILMVIIHHMIADGTSLAILIQDFLDIYAGEKLTPLRLHYKDYAEWQDSNAMKASIQQQEDYWLKEFESGAPVLNLPTDFDIPSIHTHEGDEIFFECDEKETRILSEFATKEGVTLFMVLLAIYIVLLSKLSKQELIVVGIIIAGRNHADLEQVIGMFVNTLAIRGYLPREKSFREFLQGLKKRILASFENQEYPFEDLSDKVEKKRDLSRYSLYDAGFAFQEFVEENRTLTHTTIRDLEMKRFEYKKEVELGEFLYLEAYTVGKRLSFRFRYYTRIFKRETIESFIRYFKEIMFSITNNPEEKIKNIDVVSKSEKHKICSGIRRSRENIYAEFNI